MGPYATCLSWSLQLKPAQQEAGNVALLQAMADPNDKGHTGHPGDKGKTWHSCISSNREVHFLIVMGRGRAARHC